MDWDDLLGPQSTVLDLSSADRWGAVEELVNHLVAAGKINPEHREAIVAAVKHREAAMTTGIGHEIGIPHASTGLVPEVVAVVGRSKKGIDFEALDGKPVKLVVLFLVPANQFKIHLNTLANLARLLQREDYREGLWRRFME